MIPLGGDPGSERGQCEVQKRTRPTPFHLWRDEAREQQSRPGRVGLLVRTWSRYTKVVGSIPGQGTYKNQPMNA